MTVTEYRQWVLCGRCKPTVKLEVVRPTEMEAMIAMAPVFYDHWWDVGHSGRPPRIFKLMGKDGEVPGVGEVPDRPWSSDDRPHPPEFYFDDLAITDGTTSAIGPRPETCAHEFGPGMGPEYRCTKTAGHGPSCEDQYENTWNY